jgi:hypothetical protein
MLVRHNHKSFNLDLSVHKEFKEQQVLTVTLGLLAILVPLALSALLVAWELRVVQEVQGQQDLERLERLAQQAIQELREAQDRQDPLVTLERQDPQVLLAQQVLLARQGLLDPQGQLE